MSRPVATYVGRPVFVGEGRWGGGEGARPDAHAREAKAPNRAQIARRPRSESHLSLPAFLFVDHSRHLPPPHSRMPSASGSWIKSSERHEPRVKSCEKANSETTRA